MNGTAFLALSDGTLWPGKSLGDRGRATGEVVFCTAMTGYQEVLTDPSYCRQIVVMTASHVGNTGVNDDDAESSRPWVAGFVVNQASRTASSWRASDSLDGYLAANDRIGIADVDTRALVRHIRAKGALHGALVTDGGGAQDAIELAREAPDINLMDLVGEVSCVEPYAWSTGVDREWQAPARQGGAAQLETASLTASSDIPGAGLHVVVYDLGVKLNTLRMLASAGCRVTVVPARTPASDALSIVPNGVLLSNGPGDPAALPDIVNNVQVLLGQVPVFGICLGHQVLGLALGGATYKLKFGHRGSNQPVQDRDTGAVAISSHNHGYALAADSLPDSVRVTHVNLNDGCVEGLAAPSKRAFSVQYHPEAAPGPHDAADLFDAFLQSMAEDK